MPMPSRATSSPESTRRVVRRGVRNLLGLLACSGLPLATAQAQLLQATTSEPRAFGYQVGDLVERSVVVQVPAGLALDETSLPRAGTRGKAIELKQVVHRSRAKAGGMRHEFALVYQVFLSPPEVRTLEIAPFVLRFTGEPRDQDLRVEAWPVTVSPLMPVEASPRRGLGELRPDQPPPLIDTQPGRVRLLIYGVLLVAALGYLAQVYLWLPWWARRRRPCALAWRSLRGMPADAPASEWRAAFQRVHDALNQTAGEVLFEHGVERFVATRPRYAGLREELAEFFRRSRSEFFASGPRTAEDSPAEGPWLLAFARRLRDAERGAA